LLPLLRLLTLTLRPQARTRVLSAGLPGSGLRLAVLRCPLPLGTRNFAHAIGQTLPVQVSNGFAEGIALALTLLPLRLLPLSLLPLSLLPLSLLPLRLLALSLRALYLLALPRLALCLLALCLLALWSARHLPNRPFQPLHPFGQPLLFRRATA
jgi:hypothetical protein